MIRVAIETSVHWVGKDHEVCNQVSIKKVKFFGLKIWQKEYSCTNTFEEEKKRNRIGLT